MHFDWTFSVWNLLTFAAVLVGSLWKFARFIAKRADAFESTLSDHARTLAAHGEKMAVHDSKIYELIEDVQRLIGRVELGPRRQRYQRHDGDQKV